MVLFLFNLLRRLIYFIIVSLKIFCGYYNLPLRKVAFFAVFFIKLFVLKDLISLFIFITCCTSRKGIILLSLDIILNVISRLCFSNVSYKLLIILLATSLLSEIHTIRNLLIRNALFVFLTFNMI